MLPKAHRVSRVTPRNCRWFEGISRTDAWTCCWLEILTAQKPAASPNCRAHDDLLTDVNAKTRRQEGRKKGTQRRKGARTQREEKKIGRGMEKEKEKEGEGEGERGKGKGERGKGKGLWFSLASLRLCTFAFISSPRSLLPRVLFRSAV
jgi:hypothetical protein